VTSVTASIEGVFDIDDPFRGFYDPNTRIVIGVCATANSFVKDICDALTVAGKSTSQWSVFATKSFDSGGVGVDGHQWGTTADVGYRCLTGKECFHANSTPYTVDLKSYYGTRRDDSCIPADVVGSKICSLQLTPTHIGGR
jgi:hypothetical protein